LFLSQGILYQFCLSSTPILSSAAYLCLLLCIYHTWTARVWPAIRVPPEHPEDEEKWTPVSPDTLSGPELENITARVYNRILQIYRGLWLLREERPLLFCTFLSAFFLALGALGCKVSAGAVVHGTCLLAFLLPPLFLTLTRNESGAPLLTFTGDVLSSLSNILVYRGNGAVPQEHHDLDDFMPEESAETLRSLEVQEPFHSFLSSEPEDSLSLAADMRIPSHEEVEDELDSPLPRDLELDLLPPARSMQDVPDTDSESDEEGVPGPLGQLRGVEDSSDSDSDLMPQPRVRESVTSRLTAVGSTVTSMTSMLPSMTSVLGSLVTGGGGTGSGTGGGSRRESSEPELEDFELISEDDLGHESMDL